MQDICYVEDCTLYRDANKFHYSRKKRRKRDTEQVDVAVRLNAPIRDILGSNLNPDTGYSACVCVWLLQSKMFPIHQHPIIQQCVV
jgi:hypothetical protein